MPGPRLTRRDFVKLLGLSPLLFTHLPEISPPAMAAPTSQDAAGLPNFLIIVFDTLSARHLSLHGYPRRTTPNLERLAQSATVYHRHYATANFTSPGTASILTGAYPWSHRALQMHSQTLPQYARQNLFALPQPYTTFAYTHNPLAYILLHQERRLIDQLTPIEDLCLFSDSPADAWFNRDYPAAYDAELLLYRNGFYPNGSLFFAIYNRLRRYLQQGEMNTRYQQAYPRGVPNYYDEEAPSFLYFTVEQAMDWAAAQARSQPQPFLGYVHLLPPHGPHATSRQFYDRFIDDYQPPVKPANPLSDAQPQETLDLLRRFYDESIAYVDDQFGRLFDSLEQSGALENTWLIFTSDHGELFERGTYGHITPLLYEPLIHIPLLIWQPGQSQRQDIYAPTSNVDLLPTLFQAAGAPLPAGVEGQTLPGLSLPAAAPSERSLFAHEAKEASRFTPLRPATLALIRGQHKLIYYTGYENLEDRYELYDLGSDPEELHDLYAPGNPLAKEMKDELDARLASISRRQPTD